MGRTEVEIFKSKLSKDKVKLLEFFIYESRIMSPNNQSVAVIADAKLRFETNAALTNRLRTSGKNRVAGDRKNYFQFRFGIRAKDGNVYPFTLTLFNVLLPGIEGTQENYLTLWVILYYTSIRILTHLYASFFYCILS